MRTIASATTPAMADQSGDEEDCDELDWLVWVPLMAVIALPVMFFLALGLPGLALGISLVVASSLAAAIIVSSGF